MRGIDRCVLFGALFSCIAGGAVLAQPADPTAPHRSGLPEPPHPPSSEDARRAKVIARIGEVRITVGDVEDQIARQSPFMRARYRDPEQLRQLVDTMVRFELLAREAERHGFGTDPEVREATAQSAVQQLIRERFDQRITPESVPMEDVRAYYDAHPEEFHRSELRRASHILLRTREEAERLLPRARQADAQGFRQLAQEHSLDTESRARGGDLRYFDEQGRSPNSADPLVEPAIVRAAFGLREVGEVSDPVEVQGQWSIVKLTGRRPPEHRSFEEAEPSIRLRLWRERRQAAIDAFVEQLRERTNIVVYEERMRPIRMDPPPRLGEHDDGESERGEVQDVENSEGPGSSEGTSSPSPVGVNTQAGTGAAPPPRAP
jgi:peptidyl-prolyl cis-trans isomerase C